ncbi:unnamed protein product [Symbiodinium sp. CCMP2456]|nr:unnamed protein product [Symbiodinium sp. CCMP2456]
MKLSFLRQALPLWLLILRSVSAEKDILEQWIQPLEREPFFNEVFERTWAHFPHPEPLVPITLDHVVEWIRSQGSSQEVLELLRHPVTQKSFRPSPTATSSLQQVSEAFMQGFSMVINSLHKWSEPGARLAKQLYAAAYLPVDVYMYLTPPHSRSYGLHSDVMDAFMVQLSGRKEWTVCDVPSWMAPGQPPDEILKNFNVSCSNVTLQGGDVMYLPFGTLHRANTYSDFSMHLTVNLERQFYVWQALFLAMIHKALQPGLRIKKFASGSDFQPDDDELPLVAFLSQLTASVPEMARVPGFSISGASEAKLLTSLCNQDLPEGYLPLLTKEFQDLTSRLEAAASKSKKQTLKLRGKAVSILETLGELKKAPHFFLWALELARFHSMQHNPVTAELNPLLSLSKARSKDPKAFLGLPLSQFPQKALQSLPDNARLVRAPQLRAVLLSEENVTKLWVNRETLQLRPEEVPAALFCLGLFAENASRGQAFKLKDVPQAATTATTATTTLLPKLLSLGALLLI